MSDLLRHGGPDDEGFYIDTETGVYFGHRRLALIDMSPGGHQPMPDSTGNKVICFNGEIYNFLQLKAELEHTGQVFRTQSDTEVILAAYNHWGQEAFRRLKGMFAFSLYDRDLQQVFLVRDTTGIKPLYYGYHQGALYFSSEVRAFDERIFPDDEQWKILFLSFGFIPEPYTTRKGVTELSKGHYLCYDLRNRQTKIVAYQQFEFTTRISDREEALRLVRSNLDLSVQRHLIADAPIGVFLSGGIDSSLLTLLAKKYHPDLNTLSVIFDEEGYSERTYQEEVIKLAQCRHTFHKITRKDFEEHLPQIFSAYDMPGNDGINTWFISKAAREQGLKAVLSGVGADELFGGYPSFRRTRLLPYFHMLPSVVNRLFQGALPDKWKKMGFMNLRKPVSDYLFLRGFFPMSDTASVLGISQAEVTDTLNRVPFDTVIPQDKGNYASWMELNMYMQNQLLKDSDVMSMAHGVEIRVPYLDKDLVSLMHHIDPRIKFNTQQPKQLLTDAFKGILPERIVTRKKMGFTFPFQHWLKDAPLLHDTIQRSNTYTQGILQRYRSGGLHWSKAWALMFVNR